MRLPRTNKRTNLRAVLLTFFIAFALLSQRPEPTAAETSLSNGYFVAVGDDQRFDIYFDESGALFVNAPFGESEGRWEVLGHALCVEFQDGPREGRNCEVISREGPMSLRLGDRLFLARLAGALRLS